ncbi:hypothetical protein F5Y15DRAFT_151911 [Xylariaceae sp. FL0016]|nr:hypothetical protein F5Y15DRAFT_151911 [Xylariaceae sp. FL0016]
MAGHDPLRRPRLSLQTEPTPRSTIRSSRRSLANVNPADPTSFNTLSNVYVTAIERSTPAPSTPLTAINLKQSLKLQTDTKSLEIGQKRVVTPYTAVLPDTPLSANPLSPGQQMEIIFPSTMTATPPLSAGPVETPGPVFSFDMAKHMIPQSPAQSRRRVMYSSFGPASKAPYDRNRSLHSILRNSPLPPASARSPISPRRQSLRLQEKAARRVGYESPLTQTITTERYIKSHIDLLAEEVSPYTPSPVAEDSEMMLDLAMAYSGDETRDGGQTPGPFEEMRRRMTSLHTQSPALSPRPDGGVRKRSKRKEKKRNWVWTIGQEEDEDEGGAMAAIRAAAAAEASTPKAMAPAHATVKAATPEPLTAVQISVEPADLQSQSESEDRGDVEMSDASSVLSSRATTPYSLDLDMVTPTVPFKRALSVSSVSSARLERLGSVEMGGGENGQRRDTPIPPDLVGEQQ